MRSLFHFWMYFLLHKMKFLNGTGTGAGGRLCADGHGRAGAHLLALSSQGATHSYFHTLNHRSTTCTCHLHLHHLYPSTCTYNVYASSLDRLTRWTMLEWLCLLVSRCWSTVARACRWRWWASCWASSLTTTRSESSTSSRCLSRALYAHHSPLITHHWHSAHSPWDHTCAFHSPERTSAPAMRCLRFLFLFHITLLFLPYF